MSTPRGIANQRGVSRRLDRLAVVEWRGRQYAHAALDLLPEGSRVYVVASGGHAVAVFRDRIPVERAPLCIATPAPRLAAADAAQLTLR